MYLAFNSLFPDVAARFETLDDAKAFTTSRGGPNVIMELGAFNHHAWWCGAYPDRQPQWFATTKFAIVQHYASAYEAALANTAATT